MKRHRCTVDTRLECDPLPLPLPPKSSPPGVEPVSILYPNVAKALAAAGRAVAAMAEGPLTVGEARWCAETLEKVIKELRRAADLTAALPVLKRSRARADAKRKRRAGR
jgi:hypothetical protein